MIEESRETTVMESGLLGISLYEELLTRLSTSGAVLSWAKSRNVNANKIMIRDTRMFNNARPVEEQQVPGRKCRFDSLNLLLLSFLRD